MAVLTRALMAAAIIGWAGAAQAHVSADPAMAEAGAYQVVRFRVGHGCDDSQATTGLRIEIPPGVAAARPQPKTGWSLEIESGQGPDGKSAVRAITWRGRLPADQFDEFAVLFHLPATSGPLYFPAVQTCGPQENRWTEIPDPGGSRPPSSRPAPVLHLMPAAAPSSGHQH